MGLKCGIVGLPNVGKSTLFNCLSNAKAQSANFPFCTIEPNIGTISVPDSRLVKLAELVLPERTVPNTIEIVDIAGLVKGASKGEGLGNQFLANIRETDAIIHVLRCFDDENIIHVDGSVDPIRDKEIIDTELQLKDLESVDKKIARVQKLVKNGDKAILKTMEVLESVKQRLEAGLNVRGIEVEAEALHEAIYDMFLLTNKPVMYVANTDVESLTTGNQYIDLVKEMATKEGADTLIISAAAEADIAELEDYDDRIAFLQDLGIEHSGVELLITSAYKLLELSTYFTAGEKEVRAWTIKVGMTAPQAAGVIHSDFERGFIRADVIKYTDFLNFKGSWVAAREAGKIASEGKTYVVEDGDIMLFKFNV